MVAPARERGLKYRKKFVCIRCNKVAPARERGLKYTNDVIVWVDGVAPARERGLK